MKFLFLVLFQALLASQPVLGKRILILSFMVKSRVLQANAIAEGLIENGHQVFMALDTKFNPPANMAAGINIVHYRSSGAGEKLVHTTDSFQELLFEISFAGLTFSRVSESVHFFLKASREACDMVQNQTLFAELDALKPDLIVLDATCRCLFLIPHNLGVPYVNFMPMLLADMTAPALHALLLSPGPADMVYGEYCTLSQRTFKTLLVTVLGPLFELITAYPSDKPYSSYRDLADRALLHLVDTARVYDVPIPGAPNLINVGGLVTKPAKQLQEGDLKDLVDNGDGFVLMSFGSVAVQFPEQIVETLLASIGKLKLKVVLQFDVKKLKKNQHLPSNTYASKWLPQNDLLGHEKVKVFVTHCGNSGQHEALYHGVPMFGLPIFGDQVYNAQRLVSKGFGLYIRLQELTANDFYTSMTELLQNQRYKEAIMKASEMYRDQQMSPKETAAYWINHVMKYGGDHMQSYTNRLSWYQILMLDVIAVVLCLVFVVCALFCACFRCCFWLCCRQRQQETKSIKEKAL